MTVQITEPSFYPPGAGGVSAAIFDEATSLSSRRMAQLEAPGFEMARSGRSFFGGIQAVTNGVAPVQDIPTTTAPLLLYNNAPTGQGNRALVLKRLSVSIASGTIGAAGFTLFAGLTNGPQGSPPSANSTGCRISAARGLAGASIAYLQTGATVTANAVYATLGGIMTTAVAVTGCGYSADLANTPLVCPPTYGIILGVLGDAGSSAKFLLHAFWDEVEARFP